MRVLLESGWSANLGDAAMTEGVVGMLLSMSGGVHVDVIEHPAALSVTRLPAGVGRAPAPALRTAGAGLAGKFPPAWRWDARWARLAEKISLLCGSRGMPGPCYLEFGTAGRDAIGLGELVSRYDALHIGGDGTLGDMFPTTTRLRVLLIRAFAAAGKTVVLSGQQIGPIERRLIFAAVGRALRSARLLGLRESVRSGEIVRRMGVSPDRFMVMGDDSLPVGDCGDERARELIPAVAAGASGYVAANYRVAPYAPGAEAQLDRFAGILDRVVEASRLPVLFVPTTLNKLDSDVTAAQQIVGRMRRRDRAGVASDVRTPSDAKGLLGRARSAVGMSYHFCVFALSRNTPAVSVTLGGYYGQKGEGLAETWRDRFIHAPLESSQDDDIVRRVAASADDAGARSMLAAVNDELRETHREFYRRESRLL